MSSSTSNHCSVLVKSGPRMGQYCDRTPITMHGNTSYCSYHYNRLIHIKRPVRKLKFITPPKLSTHKRTLSDTNIEDDIESTDDNDDEECKMSVAVLNKIQDTSDRIVDLGNSTEKPLEISVISQVNPKEAIKEKVKNKSPQKIKSPLKILREVSDTSKQTNSIKNIVIRTMSEDFFQKIPEEGEIIPINSPDIYPVDFLQKFQRDINDAAQKAVDSYEKNHVIVNTQISNECQKLKDECAMLKKQNEELVKNSYSLHEKINELNELETICCKLIRKSLKIILRIYLCDTETKIQKIIMQYIGIFKITPDGIRRLRGDGNTISTMMICQIPEFKYIFEKIMDPIISIKDKTRLLNIFSKLNQCLVTIVSAIESSCSSIKSRVLSTHQPDIKDCNFIMGEILRIDSPKFMANIGCENIFNAPVGGIQDLVILYNTLQQYSINK